MSVGEARTNDNQGHLAKRPKNIVQTLFKKFSAKPQSDSVPAGISKRAVLGGKTSRSRFFRGMGK